MKESLHKKNIQPDSPPWTVVVTTLVLSMVSAWLVLGKHWEPWEAFAIVGLTALAIISVLLAILLIWAGPENRAELWRDCWHTCREDMDLLLKFFCIRR